MAKGMKKIINVMLILFALGVLLLIAGFLLGGSFHFVVDLKNHKTYVPEQGDNDYINKTIDVDDFRKLDMQVDSADIEIQQGKEFQVRYQVSTWNEPIIKVEDDTLIVLDKEERDIQIGLNFEIFNFGNRNLKPEKITVTIPEGVELENFELENSFGDVYIEDIQVDDYSIKADSGNLTLSGVQLGKGTICAEFGDVEWKSVEGTECSLTADSGQYSFEKVQITKLSLEAQFGDVELMDVKVDNLVMESDSGAVHIEQLTGKTIDIDAEFGDVAVEDSTVDVINMNCDSGQIDVSLHGKKTEYDFDIAVQAGDLEINGEDQGEKLKDTSGKEKSITIQSEFGDVDIEFE